MQPEDENNGGAKKKKKKWNQSKPLNGCLNKRQTSKVIFLLRQASLEVLKWRFHLHVLHLPIHMVQSALSKP